MITSVFKFTLCHFVYVCPWCKMLFLVATQNVPRSGTFLRHTEGHCRRRIGAQFVANFFVIDNVWPGSLSPGPQNIVLERYLVLWLGGWHWGSAQGAINIIKRGKLKMSCIVRGGKEAGNFFVSAGHDSFPENRSQLIAPSAVQLCFITS